MIRALLSQIQWDSSIYRHRNKHYPAVLEHYNGSLILIDINYDEKSKVHFCKIETVTKE